ncbi:hypothetical protein HPB48_000332 [Haemaphysalis longicornis]|uniref:Rho guanine nucleotide exchange factor n=1 Tax=Haemaphysalis longicornis TaxID=44386 RepID=A0A9J6FNF6_HAELO|nr:hypothetical protein HPB48_000332 [Haemaphysalis longicornis]
MCAAFSSRLRPGFVWTSWRVAHARCGGAGGLGAGRGHASALPLDAAAAAALGPSPAASRLRGRRLRPGAAPSHRPQADTLQVTMGTAARDVEWHSNRIASDPGRREAPLPLTFPRRRNARPPRMASEISRARFERARGDFDSGAVQLVAYTRRSSLVLLSSSMEDCAGVTGVANARESDSSPGRETATAGASANGLLCGTSTAGARGAQFERFLEEARLRCASATEEQLADFVKKNRDSFARLLRIESCRLGAQQLTETRGSSPSRTPRSPGALAAPAGRPRLLRTRRPVRVTSGKPWTGAWNRTPCPLASADLRALLRACPFLDRAGGAFLSDAVSEPQLRPRPPRPFSEFPTPARPCGETGGDIGEVGVMASRMSSSFHFTTTRTHFEYCGETNTFRFRNQEVSASLGSSYESLSESEDEEDRQGPRRAAWQRNSSVRNGRTWTFSVCWTRHWPSGWTKENRAHSLVPQATVAAIFAPLKPLYRLHHDFLLPRLQERLDAWERDPRIGDVMKDFAPFLKMYAEYVKNFDQSVQLLASCYAKHPRFAAVLDEIHAMPQCGSLTVQHHMLTPVQRVPRYQLLLKEYLKKLPEGSPDKDDTERALELVSKAADHANQAMKKIDQFKQLLEIQELVGGGVDLVSPTRELLRQGKVTKISARSGDHLERYLFVFTDLALLCSGSSSGAWLMGANGYRVRARLELDGLVLQDGDNLETPNSFHLRNAGRSIELCAGSPEEKLAWMQTIAKATHDLKQRKSSLKIYVQGQQSPEGAELGQRAPVLVRADTVSQVHALLGGVLHVACGKCVPRKASLAYDGGRPGRVCNACYAAMALQCPDEDHQDHGVPVDDLPSPAGTLPPFPLPSGHRQDPGAVLSGYLRLKTGGRRAHWQRRWFALHRDFVLYSFRSERDELPLTSVPVPGLCVATAEKSDGLEARCCPAAFKLYHQRRAYVFQAQDPQDAQR